MEILAGLAGILLYLFVSGSGGTATANLKEVVVNSRFGHYETKIINNKNYTWVDQANVKLDESGVIRDELGRPYYINTDGYIDIDTQKVNEESDIKSSSL